MLASIRVRTCFLQLSALISDLLQGCGFFLGGLWRFELCFFLGGCDGFSPETFTSFHFLIL